MISSHGRKGFSGSAPVQVSARTGAAQVVVVDVSGNRCERESGKEGARQRPDGMDVRRGGG